VEPVPVRGNVDTRLRKLADGECDALVLARAGLERLGRLDEAEGILDQLVPAPGQGALALEARPGRLPDNCLHRLIDPEAAAAVGAEREVVRRLEASCHTPMGVHGRLVEGRLELSAWLGLPDGSHWIADRITGDPHSLPGELVERLEAVGARELLRAAEAAA
jgi:hydroxymethylbilane synthase